MKSCSSLTGYRPADQYGQRIHPSQFAVYCEEHIFRYPCCLCAMSGRYIEASVFWCAVGISRGEYAAECVTSTCGYMREYASCTSSTGGLIFILVNVEKFFGRACVPAVYYPQRGSYSQSCMTSHTHPFQRPRTLHISPMCLTSVVTLWA